MDRAHILRPATLFRAGCARTSAGMNPAETIIQTRLPNRSAVLNPAMLPSFSFDLFDACIFRDYKKLSR
jgi:hypothetical protein